MDSNFGYAVYAHKVGEPSYIMTQRERFNTPEKAWAYVDRFYPLTGYVVAEQFDQRLERSDQDDWAPISGAIFLGFLVVCALIIIFA